MTWDFPIRARDLATPAKTAFVVGTIVCLVNDTFSSRSALRIAMNYVVPFVVAAYSRLALLRELSRQEAGTIGTERRLGKD